MCYYWWSRNREKKDISTSTWSCRVHLLTGVLCSSTHQQTLCLIEYLTINHACTRTVLGRVHTFARLNSLFCIPLMGRICIQIFTKIKSTCSCYWSNSSTKFCRNLSTTFWNIMRYCISFSPYLSVVKKHLEINKENLKTGSKSSPKLNQFVFIKYPINLFIKLLLNFPITFWDILLTDKQTRNQTNKLEKATLCKTERIKHCCGKSSTVRAGK